MLAKNALSSIEKKLRGMHRTGRDRVEKEVSTSNLVQILIQEATDNANLVSNGL
jgi:serine/threonine-protein kinase ATR